MIKQLIEELKQTTMAQAVRLISGVAASVMLVWNFSGPIIKPYAGQAIAQVMTEQGVSPAAFKNALTDIDEIQKSTAETHSKIEKLSTEFSILLTNQSAIIAQNEDAKKRLDEIIQAIIRKQFGQANIPNATP